MKMLDVVLYDGEYWTVLVIRLVTVVLGRHDRFGNWMTVRCLKGCLKPVMTAGLQQQFSFQEITVQPK